MTDPDVDGLERAIGDLRADVAVRPEWRERLLREVAAVPSPDAAFDRPPRARGHRRFTVSMPSALAAALFFMAAGALVTIAAGRFVDSGSSDRRNAATTAGEAGAPSLVAVHFLLVAPTAGSVSLVGDFNQWDRARTPMRRARDGAGWIVEVGLPPGRHAYAFVVDGDVVADPAAPANVDEDFGVRSSVLLVSGRTE
jgi:hypothetical protein